MQTSFYDSEDPTSGNCLQACLASMLEWPINLVPHFVGMGDMWFLQMQEWFRKRNVTVMHLSGDLRIPYDTYYIRSGKSPRGSFYHATVWKDLEMVHDPHPDGTGIEPESVAPHHQYLFLVNNLSWIRS